MSEYSAEYLFKTGQRVLVKGRRDLGVGEVHQAPWESYRDKDLFFSHRRESPTGRCGSFIWLE